MFGLSKTVIAEIQGVFEQFPNIHEAIIFGSRAKGNYQEGSDIDLALIGNNIQYDEIKEVYLKMEDLNLLYNIDLKNYKKEEKSPINEHIQRVGKSFYKKSNFKHSSK